MSKAAKRMRSMANYSTSIRVHDYTESAQPVTVTLSNSDIAILNAVAYVMEVQKDECNCPEVLEEIPPAFVCIWCRIRKAEKIAEQST